MSLRAPGLLDGDDQVDRRRARTEVLAQAFADAAGGYFDRWAEYEDAITEAEDEQERMQQYGIGSGIAGIVLILGGLVVFEGGGRWLAVLLGLLVAGGGGYYAYRRYVEAEERIEENERNIDRNEPDGEVTFVSQIAVPMYLVPYGDRHMIFDGLNTATESELDLANIDGEALAAEREDLEQMKELYDEYLAGETILPPDFAREFSPGIEEHRQLEYPILDQIESMTDVAGDIEHEIIRVNVHANDRKANSVHEFGSNGHLQSDTGLPTIETTQSMGESEEVVAEIRGVEEQAISGDLLEQATDHRDRVDEIATELAERLQANQDRVSAHYEAHTDAVENATGKHVCAECLDDRLEEIDDELDLVDQILSPEAGSLGTALSDEDLDRGIDEEFTEQIREDIQAYIPELEGELRRAYNSLSDLDPEGGFCPTHGNVETVHVEDSGAVFGEVWRSLYYRFREPIMESVEDLERDAEEIRQNKEQKMIDLTQFEQIKDDVEQRYHTVRTDYEAAQMVEEELR